MNYFERILLVFMCVAVVQVAAHGFVADTLIYNCRGTIKPIKKICWDVVNHRKQYVSSFDDKTSQWKLARIRSVAHAHINYSITIKFDTDSEHDIICSPSQSFYHTHAKEWVPAYKIRPGDFLLTDSNDAVRVLDLSYQKNPIVVYLLEVKKTHTFCVGHYRVLTHNTPLTIPMACALILQMSGSFGSGAAAGAATGSFFAPVTCAGGFVIGGIIGLGTACLFAGHKIRRYDMFFNMQEIEGRLPSDLVYPHDSNQNDRSSFSINKQTGPSNGGADSGPGNDKNRKGSIENMAKFFMTSKFGKAIKDKIEKTKKIQQGQSVYKVIEDIPKYDLKKGDQLYLDARHKNHFEVFRKNGVSKKVLNLDGTKNAAKTVAAANRTLK